MYCKHCGKEITDDSLFCKYCGGKQDVEVGKYKDSKKSTFGIDKYISVFLSEKKKKYLLLYFIWAIIHIIFWMYGEESIYNNYPQDKFFPFTVDSWSHFFNVDYYDGTEFFVYVLLIPLFLYFYVQYWHKPFMTKIEEWRGSNRKNN